MSRSMHLAWVPLLAVMFHGAQAACEPDPAHVDLKPLSEQAIPLRNDFYVAQCTRLGGVLLDSTDPTFGNRLQRPTKPVFPENSSPRYQILAAKLGVTKASIYTFIVEANGSVGEIAVIESSGNKEFDAAMLAFFKRGKWTPAKLDGKPTQSVGYIKYKIYPLPPGLTK